MTSAVSSLAAKLAVEYRHIDTLKPNPDNARTHPRAQIKKLKDGIEEFGFTNPIAIGADGMVLCGHGRLEAAKLLGMTSIPTIVLASLTPAQLRAYALADNSIAQAAGWSKALLAAELQGLVDIGFNLELTGFDTLEIDTLMSCVDDEAATEEEPVELPDKETPVTRLGDHWTIGRHHLLCADACQPESYEALLSGEQAELVVTDPPYNVRIAGNVSGLGKTKHGEFVAGSGELSDGDFVQRLLRPAFRCIARNTTAGAIAMVFMDWRGGPLVLEAASGTFLEQKNLAVWVKANAGMGAFYRSQHELIYIFKVSAGTHINNFGLGGGGRHRSNVWNYAGVNSFRRGRAADLEDHPTVKPKKLVADAIRDCSTRGAIVLDPFLGSGTLLAAAEITGRRGYGLELDPKYCDVILRRLWVETGAEPVHQSGRTLTQITADRAALFVTGERSDG